MTVDLALEAFRRMLTTSAPLKSLSSNGMFFREARASEDDGTPFTPPYIVLDVEPGTPDWNTGDSAPVEDVWTVTVVTATDEQAHIAYQKLFDAFHDQDLDFEGFSESIMTDSDVMKDDELGWVAYIELTITCTETKTYKPSTNS